MRRVLIAGCGYVGTRLGQRLAAQGELAFALRRDVSRLPQGLIPVSADLTRPESLGDLPRDLDALVYCAAADARDDSAYRAAYVDGVRHLFGALLRAGGAPPRCVFVSSTSVWPADDGSWVDEGTPAPFSPARPDRVREGELSFQALAAAAPARPEIVVVRFSGIYGPGRERVLDEVERGTATFRDDPPWWTNRIHADDCARVLEHVLGLARPEPLYLASDDEPATERDLYGHVARLLGRPEPRPRPRDETGGRGANKRCSNARLKASGFVFRYPTYREGYGALADQRSSREPGGPEGAAPS